MIYTTIHMLVAFILGMAFNQVISISISSNKKVAELEAELEDNTEYTTFEEDAVTARVDALMLLHNITEDEAIKLDEAKQDRIYDLTAESN
ncbi:MAG TPA: hypothetical protein EYN67_01190, partial [Flavobacteriales bacterium]|nr:hypothetical protein [Flavobacteriales bacterium]